MSPQAEPTIEEVTLPNVKKRPMDLSRLTELAFAALKEASQYAKTLAVDEERIQVWRTTENGASTRLLGRPSIMQADLAPGIRLP
jgi:hypothetical protein